MSLTRDQIINSVHNHLDLPKNRSVEVLESVLELQKKTMENGEDVPHLTL
jgi:nucleoid DNA-binding protein